MADPTVQCGCGRAMTLDAIRGKGAYRCGCGGRIKIGTSDAEARCAWSKCMGQPVAQGPVAVCAAHRKDLLLALMPEVYAKYPPHEFIEAGRKYTAKFGKPAELPSWAFNHIPVNLNTEAPDHRVYFITLDDKVKIGTSGNVRRRRGQMCLPPMAKIVATLPGSYDLEKDLHARFADERIGRSEWFTRSARIEAFIEAIRES